MRIIDAEKGAKHFESVLFVLGSIQRPNQHRQKQCLWAVWIGRVWVSVLCVTKGLLNAGILLLSQLQNLLQAEQNK